MRFGCLIHADWSAHPRGRWAARAVRRDGRWEAHAPFQVPPLDRFRADLLAEGDRQPTLAGFDFPIGLPIGFGEATGLDGFLDALPLFGTGTWADFYDVAETAAQVGPRRPFYPRRPGGTSRQHLLDGHGVAHIDTLMRECERGGEGRRAAGCLFWTLGANQVGRAAITGWRELVAPARRSGASIWPFDGDLAALGDKGGLTLAETYPADVYVRVGAAFARDESKRNRDHRASKAEGLFRWARAADVTLTADLVDAIKRGFGTIDKGGDRFDAVIGLFGMIDCVQGRRCAAAPTDDAVRHWEGWILGRESCPDAERFRRQTDFM